MDLNNLHMICFIISKNNIKSYKDFMLLIKNYKEEFIKECFYEPSNEELLWYIYRS